MARSGMNKEVAIRYTGDTKDFKRAAADAKQIIKSQADQIKAKNAEMNSSFTKVTAAAKNAAAAMAAVFSIGAIANFTKESMKLAATAEGISSAFNALNRPGLLKNLQEATRGTVDNLKLMQKAVQANNFKIPLDQLATFFEFATKRAIQTGESVDYLVDSIITGIGRQSVLVMDNLGISAVELQKEVAKVGDFGVAAGNIIRRELTSMGDVASTTATKFETFNATVTNLKVSWGEYLNQNTLIQKTLQGVSELLQRLSDPEMNFWQALYYNGKLYEEWLRKSKIGKTTEGMTVGAFEDLIKLGIGGGKPSVTPAAAVIGPYDELVKKIKEGAEESRKMAEAWKIIHKEIAGAGVTRGGLKPGMPTVGMGLPTAPGLAGAPKMPEIVGEGFEKEIRLVNGLQDAFLGMSSAAMQGGNVLKNMADSMIDSIKRIAAELMAKAAVWAILRVIFPGLFGTLEIGSFGKFVTGGLMGGGKPIASLGMASQNINVGGQFVLKGADAYAMVSRHGNMLNGNT
jgi:hypothetical protein